MTEAEWLACKELWRLFDRLAGRLTNRKLRLFACASCRRSWKLLVDERSRRAIEIVEKYVDGKCGPLKLREAWSAAHAAARIQKKVDRRKAWPAARSAAYTAIYSETTSAVEQMVREASQINLTVASAMGKPEESARLCILLREVVGNPFRPPIAFNKVWLAWNEGAIRKMAQAIYDNRAFDRMPLLADALEEAGCDNQEILDHCRSASEHVRGCWVVDLILGKS